MADVEDLKIVFRAEVDKAIGDLKKASSAGRASGKDWDGITKTFTQNARESLSLKNAYKELTVAVAGGIGVYTLASSALKAMGKYVSDSISDYRESAGNQARLEAQIKATGGAAGYTASALRDMADGLQDATLIDDDEIAGAQSALLKFTNITGDSFSQATSLALDLSRVMGTDAASAAQTLGRALEDPAQGFASLRKAGVALSDNEEKLVKKFVAAGDAAGAQEVILKAVEERVGGVAAAIAKADPGGITRLTLALSDLKKEVGRGVTAEMKPFTEWLAEMAKNAAEARKGINDLHDAEAGSLDASTISSAIEELKKERSKLKESGGVTGFGYLGASMPMKQSSDEKALDARIAALEARLKAAQESAKKLEATAAAAQVNSRDKAAAAYIDGVDASLKAKIAAMELEAQVKGKEVDAQDKLNAYTEAYVKLITESNGLVSVNNPAAKAYAATIGGLVVQVDALAKAEKDKKKADEEAKKNLERIASLYADTPEGIKASADATLAFVQAQKANALATGASADEIAKYDDIIANLANGSKVDQSFTEWIDTNTQKLLKLCGVGKDLATTFSYVGSQLASLAVDGTVAGFQELGAAFKDGKISGEEFGEAISSMMSKILETLPTLFVEAGLNLIASNPSMWMVGLGLITAGLTSSFIDGLVSSETSTSSSATTTASAKGNVFDSGSLVRFATGGAFTNSIVKRPTNFNMGQMGERGPEAIVPLERMTSGNLGVRAAMGGGTTTTVNVHNYSGSEVSTKSSGSDDARVLEIVVGSLVDKNLASGRHDKALMGRYTVRKQVTRG